MEKCTGRGIWSQWLNCFSCSCDAVVVRISKAESRRISLSVHFLTLSLVIILAIKVMCKISYFEAHMEYVQCPYTKMHLHCRFIMFALSYQYLYISGYTISNPILRVELFDDCCDTWLWMGTFECLNKQDNDIDFFLSIALHLTYNLNVLYNQQKVPKRV